MIGTPVAYAGDGSGTDTVSPTTGNTSATGQTYTFTYTAAETMDSGGIRLAVPSGWTAPQGSSGTVGYTTVTSTGTTADLKNTLDATTNWSATNHMALSADTGDKQEGSASLANAVTSYAVANEQWYFNYGGATNWGGANSTNGARIGMWLKSSVTTVSGNLSWQDDDTASLASPLETLAVAALTANTWKYTSVTLAAPLGSVLSYGLLYTFDLGAATIKVDSIASLFDAADVTTNWTADASITVSALGSGQEGTNAIRCTYAVAAGSGTSGECYRSSNTTVTIGPGTTVSFWIRSDVALAAGDFAWLDDGNTTVASPEDVVNLPALSANTWTYVTLTAANSANKNCRSWGIRQVVDKGVVLNIDIDAMGKQIDATDATTGWTAPSATAHTLSTETTTVKEGTGSLKNVITAAATAGDKWYENFGSAQNWESPNNYTTIGLWIQSSVATTAGQLQFEYDDSADLASPIEAPINIGALSAGVWSFQKLTLNTSLNQSSILSYGIKYTTDIGPATIYVDYVLAGPGSPTFAGSGPWDINMQLLSLANTQTVTVTYGSGGGTSGVTNSSTASTHTFTTKSRVSSSGTLTNIASQPTVTLTATFSVGGTVYLADETTLGTSGANGGPCDGSAIVSLRVNGVNPATATCSSTDGSFSFPSVAANSGDTITIYLTSAQKANTVYVSDGTVDSGVKLFVDHVAVGHMTAGPVAIASLWAYDSTADDPNMLFDAVDAATDTLTVESGVELHVLDSKTFTPGGTVTTNAAGGDFHVDDNATATLDSATSAIGRDILVDTAATLNINATTTVGGGDITTAGTATVTTTSGTPTVTVSGTGNLGGGSNGLTFYNLTVSGTQTTQSAISVTNNLTADGTLAGTNNVTVNGVVAGIGTVNLTGGTFEQRVAVAQNFATTAGAAGWTFTNLTLSNSSGTSKTITTQTGGSGTITVTGTLLVSKTGDTAATVLDAGNRTWTLSNANAANPFDMDQASGSLTANSSTFVYSGDNDAGDVTVENAAFNHLTLGGSVAENYAPEGTTTVAGDLTLNANGTLSGTASVTVNGHATGAGTVNLTGGTFEQRVAAGKNFGTTSGTTAWTFNDLTFSNGNGSATPVTLTTQTGGSGTVTVNGLLVVGKTGDTAGATTTLDAGSRTWTLSGTGGDPFQLLASPAGALTANSSTITYTGNNGAANTTVQAATYTNLTLNNGAETYDLEGTTAVTNDLIVTAGTLGGSQNITVNGNVTGAGAINLAGGTFDQRVAAAKTFGTTSTAGTWTFNNLTFSNSTAGPLAVTTNAGGTGSIAISGTFQIGKGTDSATTTLDDETNDRILDLNGDLTITSQGSLTASSTAAFTAAGNWTNNGTFAAGTGTVTFDTAATATFDGSGTPATIFNNFTSTTAGKILNFTAGKTFRINGLLTITGTSGAGNIHIHSTTASPWFINHQGTEAVTYAHIDNSGCDAASTTITVSDGTSTNGGNNGTCWDFGGGGGAGAASSLQVQGLQLQGLQMH